MARVRVDGTWLHALTKVSDLRWKHGADGGCLEASWSISQRPGSFSFPVLRRGAEVEIFDGIIRVWYGRLSEPGEETSACLAVGPLSDASRYLCVTSANQPTSSVNTGITQAIVDGLKITYNGDAPTGVPATGPQYLDAAIAAAATSTSTRATVRADGILRFEADPTVPSLVIAPGVASLGRSDEDWATHVYCYYVSAVSGTPSAPSAWATALASAPDQAALYGRATQFVDLTDRGLLTSAQAAAIATGILAKTGARLSITNGLTVTSAQLRDVGGQRASLAQVTAGRMVRLLGVRTPDGAGSSVVDVVIGSTDYLDGSGQITLNPLGMVPRSFADVIASIPKADDSLESTPGAGITAA